jgi:hypothetical protein
VVAGVLLALFLTALVARLDSEACLRRP